MELRPTFANEEEGKRRRVLDLPENRPAAVPEIGIFAFSKNNFQPPSVSVIHLAIVCLGGSHIDLRVAAVSCLSVVILGVISPLTSRVFSSPRPPFLGTIFFNIIGLGGSEFKVNVSSSSVLHDEVSMAGFVFDIRATLSLSTVALSS
ncbi:hypothetical protein GALMADRAFT_1139125 [Galerina marginata CBS 339.88]|uniref:Uncharacterized protein n=1 Tax=Galerina marginata (strain CBS 339.88) TaxID=685588 RepID=A0A067SIX3_GALM3|nr:hypothetical protein GALMADRAFT_1139125 [Galerina marginata CBS 339.88]